MRLEGLGTDLPNYGASAFGLVLLEDLQSLGNVNLQGGSVTAGTAGGRSSRGESGEEGRSDEDLLGEHFG